MSAVLFALLAAVSCAAAPAGSGKGKASPAENELKAAYYRTAGIQRQLQELMKSLQPALDRISRFKEEYGKASDLKTLEEMNGALYAPYHAEIKEFFQLERDFLRAKEHLDVLGVAAATTTLLKGSYAPHMPRDIGIAMDLGAFHHEMRTFSMRLEQVRAENLAAYLETKTRLAVKERDRMILLVSGLVCGPGLLAWLVIRWRRRDEAPRCETVPVVVRPDAPRPSFAPGTLLEDNYRVEREVSRDELGVVFEAFDISLGRKVALKRLPEGAALSEPDLEALLHKAQTAASLRHPNIVEIYAIVNDGPMPCPVFELVEGKTLSRVLAHGPLSLAAAKSVVRQAAAALEHAHGRGVFHGSLQPASIMVKADGTAKLTDFGMAPGGRRSPYSAPEQERGLVTRATDVFSLGACAYAMLAGGPPPEKPSGLLPAGAQPFMLRALHPEPRRRFESAWQLAAAFETVRWPAPG